MSTLTARPASGFVLNLAGPLAVGMLLIFSAAWVFPLTGEDAAAADGGLVRNLYLPAYALAMGVLVLAPTDTARAVVRQPFLLALLAIAATSTFWSIAPDQTARRVFAVSLTTIGGLVLAARFRWAGLAEVGAAAFAILAAISLIAAVAVPSIGVMSDIFPGAWRGTWSEKNALGGVMALGFTWLAAAAMLNPQRRLLWWGFAGLTLFLVIMSTSKTSLLSLLVGAGMLVFVWLMRRGPATRVVTVWLAVVAVMVLVGAGVLAADAVFEVLGKDATLTGRTEIWSAALRQIEQRPWTGFGYEVVWDVTGPWSPFAWIARDAGFTPQHAHNAWLEQWLGMGVLGLVAFGLFYLQSVALTIAAVARHAGAYLAAPFLAVYSLMTITESVAFTYNDLRWVLFVAVAARLTLADPDVDAAGAQA